jgi:signal transduction histidine kinase
LPEKGRIKILSENKDEFIKVVVEDNGTGIDEEILDKIFDPFFTTKAKGTGLGLTVCRHIINMHDGEINVNSKLGKGTSFIVSLLKK